MGKLGEEAVVLGLSEAVQLDVGDAPVGEEVVCPGRLRLCVVSKVRASDDPDHRLELRVPAQRDAVRA